MPHYLLQAAYTRKAWTAIMEKPENRLELIRPAITQLGGRLMDGWASLGHYDIVVVVELPENVSAAAFEIAAMAGGQIDAHHVTPLLTMDELQVAAQQARETSDRAPFDPVQAGSEQSFPASDPPSWMSSRV